MSVPTTDGAPLRLRLLPSWLIAQAALHAQRLTARSFDVLAMRRQHFAVLTALADFGASSQAELGRRVSIDRSDMAGRVHARGEDWPAITYDDHPCEPGQVVEVIDIEKTRLVVTAS